MNELAMLLACAKKVLEKQESGGLKKENTKMSYKRALECLESLETYFGLGGNLTIGICKDCSKWTCVYTQSKHDCIGYCTLKKIHRIHAYDTCDQNDSVPF